MTYPDRSEIAAAWRRDPDEPACFACAFSSTHWSSWDDSGLERAHVIAASSGGSGEPSNFVLLCKECHQAAPMTGTAARMHRWINRRPHHLIARAQSVLRELEALGVSAEQANALSKDDMSAALRAIGAGLHGGRLSPATMAEAISTALDDARPLFW